MDTVNKREQWSVKNVTGGKHLGVLELESGEYFDIMLDRDEGSLVFGSPTNNTFLQSGFMWLDSYSSIDSELQELIEELEVYYRDGYHYCSRIVCNDRM